MVSKKDPPPGVNLHPFYLGDHVMFFKNGGNIPLLINRYIPRLYQDIRVVETCRLIQLQRMSWYRVPLSDNVSEPLPRITMRKDVWSERQLEKNPMGLRKCHPITVNTLTVRGSQKHPSTNTNFLPE